MERFENGARGTEFAELAEDPAQGRQEDGSERPVGARTAGANGKVRRWGGDTWVARGKYVTWCVRIEVSNARNSVAPR
jgi:hypothetical protein